jgi:hypothetical protein
MTAAPRWLNCISRTTSGPDIQQSSHPPNRGGTAKPEGQFSVNTLATKPGSTGNYLIGRS